MTTGHLVTCPVCQGSVSAREDGTLLPHERLRPEEGELVPCEAGSSGPEEER